MTPSIAIILPAYNEELTIEGVMREFHEVSPEAALYVVDNNSKDKTAEIAERVFGELKCRGGLLSESRQGKAMAMRKAFMEIEADFYVMVDADLTYPAEDLPKLLEPALAGEAEVVCGDRHHSGAYQRENKRPLHNFGNQLVRVLINLLFKGQLRDILTGYRVLSRRFVKNYPILCDGFELETEMSIHALDKGYAVIEVPTAYKDRPDGSFSKLQTFSDGVRVLKTIFSIVVEYRPLLFFSACAAVFALCALGFGSIPIIEYFRTGLVTRFPLAILASGLSILAMLSFCVGVILNGIASAQRFEHSLSLLHWTERENQRRGA